MSDPKLLIYLYYLNLINITSTVCIFCPTTIASICIFNDIDC